MILWEIFLWEIFWEKYFFFHFAKKFDRKYIGISVKIVITIFAITSHPRMIKICCKKPIVNWTKEMMKNETRLFIAVFLK